MICKYIRVANESVIALGLSSECMKGRLREGIIMKLFIHEGILTWSELVETICREEGKENSVNWTFSLRGIFLSHPSVKENSYCID